MNRLKPTLHHLLLFGLLTIMGCGLEQEIDLELPPYDRRTVVECYLEPGKPITLLLSRSAPFFAPLPGLDFLESLLVSDADVRILYRGDTILLQNELTFIPATGKVYNYRNGFTVPEDYDHPFHLRITTEDNEYIEASTKLIPPIAIDSLVFEFRENDTLARALTYLTDPPEKSNYYRWVLNEGSLDNDPEQDFPASDRVVENVLVFGTGFEFTMGDTIISTLFHVDSAYYNFLQSVQQADQANGNPFGQPAPILGNVQGDQGAFGIFTGISYSRERIVISQ